MPYSYDPIFAADPNNPSTVASNAAITIFNPSDAGKAPITITDVTGSPLPNPITVNRNGFGPAFQHPTLDRVGWHGGGFTGYFTSYEGIKNEAVAARTAAQEAAATAGTQAAAAVSAATASVIADAESAAEAASDASTAAANSAVAAANAAALVGTPADSAIAAAVNGNGATKTALNSAYATKAEASAGAAAAQTARRVNLSDTVSQLTGDWYVRRNNEAAHIFIRDLGSRNYLACEFFRSFQDFGTHQLHQFWRNTIGTPMIGSNYNVGTYTGTWTVSPTINEFEGWDGFDVIVNTTSGVNAVQVPAGNVPLGLVGRRITIPGAGAGGATLQTFIGNNTTTSISGNSAPQASLTGVKARVWAGSKSSTEVGATATYVTPAGATGVGVVITYHTSGGLAKVSIDGSATAANLLPTAQDVVNRGSYPNTILVANGGTLNPTDRVIDFYRGLVHWSIPTALATNLAPGAHTVVLTVAGYTAVGSSNVRGYIQGWGYTTGAETPLTPGARIFSTDDVGLSRSAIEYAIRHQPAGAPDNEWAGSTHGYESPVSFGIAIDGEPVTLTDGEVRAVRGSATVTRVTKLHHKNNPTTVYANIDTVYRFDKDGMTIRHVDKWATATNVTDGRPVMLSQSGRVLDRGQLDASGAALVLTGADDSNKGLTKSTSAVLWDADGQVAAAVIMPNVQQITGNWSGLNVWIWDRTPSGNEKINKVYTQRVGPVVPGDVWVAEATYKWAKLPDGAFKYLPIS